MAKHRAPRYARTKKILAGAPVVAGATIVGLGVLSSPAQAHTTGSTTGTTAIEAPVAAPVSSYTVKRGDTVAEIAAAHGQSWRQLYQRNVGLIGGNPNVITPGQALQISGASQAVSTAAPAPSPAQGLASAPAALARITNTAGPVRPQTQTAANAVVASVPGAAGITIGGTRPSAADPGGHPSGRALDYMVMSNAALGDAIVQYHMAHWNELGVEYIIWQQRILTSPTGSWKCPAPGSVEARN